MSENLPAFPNPLSFAFGAALKFLRGNTKSITKAAILGVSNSYINLLESGTSNLSVSRILKLLTAYPELEFEPTAKLLVAINVTDNATVSLQSYLNALRDLITAGKNDDYYFEILLRGLSQILRTKIAYDQQVVEDALLQNGLQNDMLRFLTTRTTRKGELNTTSIDAATDLQDEFDFQFEKMIGDTPSIYIDTVSLTTKSLQSIGTTLFVEESSKWENENNTAFVSLYAVVTDFNRLLDPNNISTFDLKYLLLDTFEELHYVILNTEKCDEKLWTEKFHNSLKDRWEFKTNKGERSYYDKALDKIKIKKASLSNPEIVSFLTTTSLNDIVWIFLTTRGNKVGFALQPKPSQVNMIYGETLTYKMAKNKYHSFKQLWATL